ncbi:MAG: site-2 protease family protein [Candidatus Zambryskibacteria bacterium CG10_big_fil_rev_8_21_14_0_10_42_12]|uniref:Site-2 protease family protein n=1 Tax=Candidatus Zambryskibacteria bacterium CG10_big_fil_rev_8_21_14_0_10_42_12 TaxID=1975115 RepID=A0A2H0QX34_9BACT|nr:MAG: site-2 protease family protein [Candidatus Zambryskibacteria bacterium CG10_big_fil_rev_8_21_14_0_10_42_12]
MAGIDFFFVIAILLVSVVLHELAHGYAALKLGDPTALYAGRLTLNPLKHIDPFGSLLLPIMGYLLGGFIIGWAKPVPFNPYNLQAGRWGEALVAAAGPASNIVIALLFTLLIRFGGFAGGFIDIVSYIVLINIVLACFNLIPIPPLDGSKIVFAFLPLPFVYKYRMMLESYGIFLAIAILFVVWPLLFPFVLDVFGLVTGIPV